MMTPPVGEHYVIAATISHSYAACTMVGKNGHALAAHHGEKGVDYLHGILRHGKNTLVVLGEESHASLLKPSVGILVTEFLEKPLHQPVSTRIDRLHTLPRKELVRLQRPPPVTATLAKGFVPLSKTVTSAEGSIRMMLAAAKQPAAPAPIMAMRMCGSVDGKEIIVDGGKHGNDGKNGHRAEKAAGNLLYDEDADNDGNEDINIICEICIHSVAIILLEQHSELGRNGGLEFHALACHGMEEAQQVGVEAEAVDGVVAVAVLDIATYGMAHIGRVYPNLVLASCLQLKLYERVLCCAVENAEMRHGVFATIVYGA